MSETSKTRDKSSLAALVYFSGAAASFVGFLALLGWITGLRSLVSLRSDYVPMSPDTALIFVIFGLILFFLVRVQGHRRSKIFVTAIIALISLYGFLKFAEYFVIADLTFQESLFPATEKMGIFFIKRMSPVTGMLFFLSGIALELRLMSSVRYTTSNVISGLGVIMLSVGFVATTGYVF